MSPRFRTMLLTCALGAAAAPAKTESTRGPTRLHFDWFRHPYPCDGGNGARNGWLSTSLPARWELAFRGYIPGGIQSLAVAHPQRILVSTRDDRLVELDAQGRELWSQELGSPATSNVAVSGENLRLVVLRTGWMLGYDARGRLEVKADLQLKYPEQPSLLLPLASGDIVAGSMRDLVWLDRNGQHPARTELAATAHALYSVENAVVVVSSGGEVHVWNRFAAPRSLGDFGGSLRSKPIVVDEFLVALTDTGPKRKHLVTGRLQRWTHEVEIQSDATLIRSGRNELAWIGPDAVLHRAQRKQPVESTALEPLGLRELQNPRLLADAAGRIALLSASGEFVMLPPEGDPRFDSELRCSDPSALASAGPKRLVLSCSSGAIWGFADVPH